MTRPRLDNGRSMFHSLSSQPSGTPNNESLSLLPGIPQTSPLTLELLSSLLESHTWSTYQDENDRLTAIHVETKDGHGHDRFKYILRAEGSSGNTVLLSKQKHFARAESTCFVTLNVKCLIVAKPVAILVKEGPLRTSTRITTDSSRKEQRLQTLANILPTFNHPTNAPLTHKSPDENRFLDNISRFQATGHDNEVDSAEDVTSTSPSETVRSPHKNPVLDAPKPKRKRLPAGSYKMLRPPKLRKKRRATSDDQDINEISSDSSRTQATPHRKVSRNEDGIPHDTEHIDSTELIEFSDDDKKVHYSPTQFKVNDKTVRVEDWIQSSQ